MGVQYRFDLYYGNPCYKAGTSSVVELKEKFAAEILSKVLVCPRCGDAWIKIDAVRLEPSLDREIKEPYTPLLDHCLLHGGTGSILFGIFTEYRKMKDFGQFISQQLFRIEMKLIEIEYNNNLDAYLDAITGGKRLDHHLDSRDEMAGARWSQPWRP